MLTLLFVACVPEKDEEQQCFLAYLDDANATDVAYYTCSDAAEDEDEQAVCATDLDDGQATDLATLGTCAGEGCVADWEACMETAPSIDCYDTLEACGGWIYAGIVDDCTTDIAFCGSSEGCANDYYDCMRFAAGG